MLGWLLTAMVGQQKRREHSSVWQSASISSETIKWVSVVLVVNNVLFAGNKESENNKDNNINLLIARWSIQLTISFVFLCGPREVLKPREDEQRWRNIITWMSGLTFNSIQFKFQFSSLPATRRSGSTRSRFHLWNSFDRDGDLNKSNSFNGQQLCQPRKHTDDPLHGKLTCTRASVRRVFWARASRVVISVV